MNKLDFIKIENFTHLKIINQVERQPTEWEKKKIFAYHISENNILMTSWIITNSITEQQ